MISRWHYANNLVCCRTTDIAPYKPLACQSIRILVVKEAVELILQGDQCIQVLAMNP